MNEQQQQLQALLERAGLGDMSKYFTGDVGSLISALGFTNQRQKEQFSKFFQGFDPAKYLQAEQEVGTRFEQQTGMVGDRLSDALEKIKSQVGTGYERLTDKGYQTEQKIDEIQAKGRFDHSGIGEKIRRKEAIGRERSLRDILEQAATGTSTAERQYESGMLGAEKQRGAGMGAVYRSLQNWLNQTLGRGENIFALDPFQNQYTPGDPGGGGGTGSGTGSSIGTGMGTYL